MNSKCSQGDAIFDFLWYQYADYFWSCCNGVRHRLHKKQAICDVGKETVVFRSVPSVTMCGNKASLVDKIHRCDWEKDHCSCDTWSALEPNNYLHSIKTRSFQNPTTKDFYEWILWNTLVRRFRHYSFRASCSQPTPNYNSEPVPNMTSLENT